MGLQDDMATVMRDLAADRNLFAEQIKYTPSEGSSKTLNETVNRNVEKKEDFSDAEAKIGSIATTLNSDPTDGIETPEYGAVIETMKDELEFKIDEITLDDGDGVHLVHAVLIERTRRQGRDHTIERI